MKKRIISLILCAVMLSNVTVALAAAEFVVTSSYFEYNPNYSMQNSYVSIKNIGDASGRVTVKGYVADVEGDSISKDIDAGATAEFGMLIPQAAVLKAFYNNEELVQEDWNTSEPFRMVTTSLKDNFSPQQALYFTFNRPVDTDVTENIILYENGNRVACKAKCYQNRLDIEKNDGVFCYGSNYRVDLGCVTDLFGNGLTETEYTFSTVNLESEFPTYQEAGIITQEGVGGAAMLATLNGDSKICFSRTTYGTEADDLPFVPSCYAKIINPMGELVEIHDFTNSPAGTTTVIDDIQYMEGIWTIQFISGRNSDVVGIGISNARSWGIRGELILGVTETTPFNSYVYVPDKVNAMLVASEKGKSFRIYDANENLVGQSATLSPNYNYAKTGCTINNPNSNQIYKISLDAGFYGGLIIDRIPSLMCPTAEMANELKGGWRNVEGIICQGAIQENARREALRLLSVKNFDVPSFALPSPSRPTNVPQVSDPVAESLLFGSYGLVTPLKDQLRRQVLDPNSPYLGRILTTDEYDAGGIQTSWETGTFKPWGEEAFGALISTDAELNYYYENSALINRSALSILGSIAALSEDFIIRETNATEHSTRHGNFYFCYIAKCYAQIREYLDAQTISVIDSGIEALCDKQGNFRGFQTNQWMHTACAVEAVWRATGNERHLDFAKRHISGLCNGVYMGKYGQNAAGYYMEEYGCDGNYNNLSQSLIFTMYKEHKNSPNPDSELLGMLYNSIQKSIEFDSLFWLPQPTKVGGVGANCFTSRTEVDFERINHIDYPVMVDELPLAKRRFEIQNAPPASDGAGAEAATFPYYINNNAWAYRLLNRDWAKYDNKYTGYTSNGNPAWYTAIKNRNQCQSEPLPCEQQEGIWEKPGIIAVKHKGLYFNIFYRFDVSHSAPNMSFMGGGLTTLWSEPTGVVLASKKHNNYNNITSADDIMATCVYGKNANEDLIFNGKETASFEWIEQGESFKITENISNSDAVVVWKYTLNENDVEMEVNVSGNVHDMWLNIPVLKSEPNAVNRYDSGAVYQEYDGYEVAFSTENEFQISQYGQTMRFRVKLDNTGNAVVNISAQSCNGLQIAGTDNNSVTVLNGTSDTKYVNVYYSECDNSEKLISLSADRIRIAPHTYSKFNKISGKRMFVWDDFMQPILA